MADAQKSNSKDGFKRELPMTYNRTASINVHNEKVPFIWLAKKDNLMLLNLKKTSSINFNHTDYTCSHQLNVAFSLLQSAFFATNFSLKKRDPNLELF